ncbi:MAG TPA: hypothetical protein DCS91_10300 [Microcoleaceae bacterium UBA11344]|nr:hypothetical protein [Microcoleaceae cyanobacterium UBA11344]
MENTPVHAAIETTLEAQLCFVEAGLKPSEYVNSIIELLEKLPLPLRLQTPTGQLVSENAAWQFLLGGGTESVTEIAAILGTASRSNSGALISEYKCVNSKALINECWSLLGAANARDRDDNIEAVVADGDSLHLFADTHASILSGSALRAIAGKPGIYICECPVQKGQDRFWQFIKQPLSDHLILVMGQDVTDEHLVGPKLEAKNTDLIQLNRVKHEFLSCISHELKTPLTAVLGLSSLLKDNLIGVLNDRQSRYAHLIYQSGRQLMFIVNDILDLTRLETGQLELFPESVDITAVCNEAFAQVKQLDLPDDNPRIISLKNSVSSPPESADKIEFILEIEPGLSFLIADKLRLCQMLVNLLSNALKFTDTDGKIGLKVNVWDGSIAFTVWDNGIGIPADKQHLIFQKFQQLKSPLTHRFQGTGLGLVLTQGLARLHGGDVSFISSECQGSQFTLLLPLYPPGNSREELAEYAAVKPPLDQTALKTNCLDSIANSRSRLVLIVEAFPKYIEDLTNLLTSLGYQVMVARSGTEALEKARRFSPEAIFLNPLLPILSGWDVLTLLKSDPDTRSIPAIVTATRGEKERASVNGAEGFLSLPIAESALRWLLGDLICHPDDKSDKVKSSLTILWLSPQNSSSQGSSLLQDSTYCRILEVDDIDQAEQVALIWRPSVIVLDSTNQLQNPSDFIEQLSQSSSLGSLPLVTLDPATTQLANQVKKLSVFPCLAASSPDETETDMLSKRRSKKISKRTSLVASALWQVIQVAAGMS